MIKELKTLIAVAREGTFAAAGDRIGLTQAAVSAQMQRLEAQLGVELFDRKGRSAQLNRMGQQVLLQGQELVRLYGSLGNSATGSAPNVLVTIGAIASVQRSFLPDALALFHRQFPQCRTRVIPGLSMDLVNQVDAGEVDLAAIIRPPFSLHSDLRWTTLMREPYRLIVPADLQGEDWAELISSQPFIRYDRSSFGGRQVDRFLRQTHVSLREVCELDELDAIVKLVANGVGVALVPETATIQAWPAGVRAVDLGPHTFHRDIGLVHRARRSLAEPVNVLARLLTAQVLDTQ
ncbi:MULTISPECIES: LysR family transcriptional regulator [Pseudomonas syringae group]|uniref:Transcriptional regulator, LysR family n=1 Tax=Pseudomonas syringae pv. maculicola TaxID=59511 RepID=A0A0N0WXX1_PSEYM|nr:MULTISPECIES: LysR family transcriptional regulator [Pseudomonas syringae group]KPC05135.1 Transcriptional regulator [Pseudomonas syringae pv. maculicola str. M6]KPC13507.1 Transcriptional regulator [Pseudomonas syringae pv. maculicola]KPX77197.1 Transcriptional regulator, LysR family [Pseudomonas syringae pv. maculicola]MBM0210157.1 LysR family transcriptional regulator [Pseudomonas syringae pv. maculicola]RMM81675.1 Transcriptional regulator, LysR family [Pseudomonas syringae pv. maculico